MKKILLLTLVGVLAVTLMSCASTSSSKAKEEVPPVATTGTEGMDMPDWFLATPRPDEEYFYAAGMGKMANFQNSLTRAEMNAKDNFAQQVSTDVTHILDNFLNDAGEGDNRQAIDSMNEVSRQISKVTLRGVQRTKVYKATDGTVYVLCSIPRENMAEIIEKAKSVVNTFTVNDAAQKANDAAAAKFAEYEKAGIL